MNSATLIALCAALAGGVAFAAVQLVPPAPAVVPGAGSDGLAARLDGLIAAQEGVVEKVDALGRRLDAVEARAARERPPEVDEQRLHRIVQEVLAEAVPAPGGGAAGSGSQGAAAPADAPTVEGLMAELSHATSYEDQQAIWSRAVAAGLVDQMVERFEMAAKADPDNPSSHVGLANAYLHKLFTVPEGPEQGKWAMKADHALDDALDIDPNHWEARFSKATSLSFWPPIFGKGPEAAKHFEILVEQQETSGVRKPEYAQTYVYLGNLYSQQGKADKAEAMWKRGLSMFPDNAELRNKAGQ